MMQNRRMRAGAAVAALVTMGTFLSACGGDDAAADDVTLRVNVFGNFGYEKLYKQFEKDHPGVTIVETAEGDLGQYNTQLIQKIAAGSGAGDVVAIEEGQVVNFLQSADRFVNFQDHGSNEKKDQWLDWKYAQATTADGGTTIGLGTDVGGLAMCYRRDLFEKAGLPTDREEVGKLWPTWDDYIATGEKFQAGIGSDEVHFVDSATNTYNSILMQTADHTYFDTDDNLVIETNPAVKDAWDTSVAMVDAGLSAKLKSFSNEWNAGFKNGTFATIACPAWMTGYIKEQAGDGNAGNWDIAPVPGGGGNWGGSFLAVPTSSSHQDVAIELAQFLTSADGQMSAFDQVGNLPSNPTLYSTPELENATNDYFNDAPVGQLFVAGASNLRPVYLGAKNQPVRDAVENALRSVENGQKSSEEGWQTAVDDAGSAAG
ncbi:carbohydrate ABC transporter substrate-binding protein [Nocardioides guangzhouensis]|uniref:Carbohydrate ABC transporter substrate-binding protein n=1 Tax=Nocardioides guangzhouensis TaxID=2497878 RepID=A0A4Q4Z6R7_9ACTN|nr:ABC transporter substrate-binding protein [Nocardioides guangzhouensis]RYP83520.1 carbohydrate ABC transporter substrate-binding protein [Nocardioides guangzhouensis]